MNDYDMGVSIISPYDKGGCLFAPSTKLLSLTLPDMDPIQYGSLWLFYHKQMDEKNAPIHTMVCGAARQSDLDEPAVAAYLFDNRKGEMLEKVQAVETRLHKAMIETHGEDWVKTWHEGVPNCVTLNDPYNFGQMLSLYNIIKAWGLLEYSRERYSTFDGNLKMWDWDLSVSENIQGNYRWKYMPGIALEPEKEYSRYLKDVPDDRKKKILEALQFVHQFCSITSDQTCLDVPREWETAYDMRPWTAFPDRRRYIEENVKSHEKGEELSNVKECKSELKSKLNVKEEEFKSKLGEKEKDFKLMEVQLEDEIQRLHQETQRLQQENERLAGMSLAGVDSNCSCVVS